MQPHIMLLQAVDCLIERHFYGLSFWGEDGVTADEIAQAVGMPQRMMRTATAGGLRAGGYEPERDAPPPLHVVVRFAAPPTETMMRELAGAFGEPLINPGRPG